MAKENCSGMELDSRKIRVDYSTTHRPHTPTPGVYMGRPTRTSRDYDRRGGGVDDENYYRERRSSRERRCSRDRRSIRDRRSRERCSSRDRRSTSPYRQERRRRYGSRSRSRSYSPRDRK